MRRQLACRAAFRNAARPLSHEQQLPLLLGCRRRTRGRGAARQRQRVGAPGGSYCRSHARRLSARLAESGAAGVRVLRGGQLRLSFAGSCRNAAADALRGTWALTRVGLAYDAQRTPRAPPWRRSAASTRTGRATTCVPSHACLTRRQLRAELRVFARGAPDPVRSLAPVTHAARRAAASDVLLRRPLRGWAVLDVAHRHQRAHPGAQRRLPGPGVPRRVTRVLLGVARLWHMAPCLLRRCAPHHRLLRPGHHTAHPATRAGRVPQRAPTVRRLWLRDNAHSRP